MRSPRSTTGRYFSVKRAPISFESFWWLGEWDREGWDIDEAIEKTLSWHISTFNAKSFPIPEKWRDKIDAWLRRMGYHFYLSRFEYPPCADAGDVLRFCVHVENSGVAPIYNAIPLRLRLCGGGREYVFTTDVDIREWMPGENTASFEVVLPADAASGAYDVELSISGENTPLVRWESQGERDGLFFKAGRMEILGS